jgi:hypothetical protein
MLENSRKSGAEDRSGQVAHLDGVRKEYKERAPGQRGFLNKKSKGAAVALAAMGVLRPSHNTSETFRSCS